jgi:hypothetical protein
VVAAVFVSLAVAVSSSGQPAATAGVSEKLYARLFQLPQSAVRLDTSHGESKPNARELRQVCRVRALKGDASMDPGIQVRPPEGDFKIRRIDVPCRAGY